jgi:simple sugar transport system substrate-binding protein
MLAATAILLIGASTAYAAGAKIFVIGGKPDDPFWSIVKRGAEDAGKVAEAEGGSVTWLGPQNYDNLGVDAAELIRQAIDQKADAIVGPDWVPEGDGPGVQGCRRRENSVDHLQCRRPRGGRQTGRDELCRLG